MSDTDVDGVFGATHTTTSASEDEERDRRVNTRTGAQRRTPLAKRPSLQKRKKPAKTQRRSSKATDPFDDADLFKPSDAMEEEMNAMKQVFLRMSEKKLQQKEERKAECKRLYKEAFHADVEQAFRKAAKVRSKIMDSISEEINVVKTQLRESRDELLNAHKKYKEAIGYELSQAEREIDSLRGLLSDLESQFSTAKKNVELEFDEVSQAMELSLKQLEVKLIKACQDKSFLNSFQPHLERLL